MDAGDRFGRPRRTCAESVVRSEPSMEFHDARHRGTDHVAGRGARERDSLRSTRQPEYSVAPGRQQRSLAQRPEETGERSERAYRTAARFGTGRAKLLD